jgi:hypothetical protein
MIGVCHICQQTKDDIEFCGLCNHFFCGACRGEWWPRITGALVSWFKERFYLESMDWKTQQCCGPEAVR